MMILLVFKEHLKKLYNSYGTYINMLLRTLAMITALILINSNIGYMTSLKSPVIVLGLALLAAFLPNGINVLLLTGVTMAHIYRLSMELAVVVLVIVLIMYLLYYRFTPKDGYVLMLLPVLFFLKIPYVVPLIMGLVATPVSIISVAFGTIMFFMMQYASDNAATITNVTEDSGIQKITSFLDGILKNKEMWIIIFAFSVTILVVYFVKRVSIDHAWEIAVISGGIIDVVIILAGGLGLRVSLETSLAITIVMALLSMGIVYVLQFMILAVDFTRTEYVQFEDDDYYYYVKAVPKVKVTTQNVKVKRINAGNTKKTRR